ncbi:Copper-transporting ATPase PAA1, chloroplastic [Linum grandiflorum]
MEACSAPTTLPVFTISKSLKNLKTRSLVRTFPVQYSKSGFLSAASQPRKSVALSLSVRHCVTKSGESGGGGSGGDEGGEGGGGGSEGGDVKPGGGVGEGSALSSDVIILTVGGMTCGGCVASVKKILESQPQVYSASVDLTTETATVWAVSEAKTVPDWKKQLGHALANHLTSCGFTSNPRGEEAVGGDA